MLDSMVSEIDQINERIQERVNSEEFKNLIAARDAARIKRAELDAKRAANKSQRELKEKIARNPNRSLKNLDGEGTDPRKPTREEVENAVATISSDYEEYRNLTNQRLDAHYELTIANDAVEKFKDETAKLVARKNEILGDPGTPYEGETLGNCVPVATYDSGTREWLEERVNGIGGSDVGSMLRVDPEYAQSNYADFVKSKTEPYSDEEIAEQARNNSEFTGPTGRGNAWEPEIIRMFAKKRPEMKVFYSKTSWANKDFSHYKCNVDGLLAIDSPVVNAILEIKTASHRDHWFDANGNEIVPLGYRAQVLWYLHQTGFKRAIIVALIDDTELVMREIWADEPIAPSPNGIPTIGSMSESMNKIEDIWVTEIVSRKNGTYKAPSRKSFFDDCHKSTKIDNTVRYMSGWTDLSHAECKSVLRHASKTEYPDEFIVEFLKGFGPESWNRDRVYVDIETSGSAPSSGEIIEVGIVRVNPSGEVVFRYHERYGLKSEEVLEISGTGFEELHHITRDDIRGKRNFLHPEVQAIMQEHLNDPNAVMVAHNEHFERRWFNQTVDNFFEMHNMDTTRFLSALRSKEEVEVLTTQDTMWTSRYLAHHTANNKLATFTEGHGIPYVDAHRADVDAEMTMKANYAFAKLFQSAPVGERYQP